jgi:hypothetical protein
MKTLVAVGLCLLALAGSRQKSEAQDFDVYSFVSFNAGWPQAVYWVAPGGTADVIVGSESYGTVTNISGGAKTVKLFLGGATEMFPTTGTQTRYCYSADNINPPQFVLNNNSTARVPATNTFFVGGHSLTVPINVYTAHVYGYMQESKSGEDQNQLALPNPSHETMGVEVKPIP